MRSWSIVTVVAMIAWGAGAAQELGGTYEGPAPVGAVRLELGQDGERLTGALVGPGVHFELDGVVEAGVGYGHAHTAEGSVGFEVHLFEETLGLYLFDVDAWGDPIEDSVVELILTRVGGPSGAPTIAGAGGAPAGPGAGAAGAGPTAPVDPFGVVPAADPLVGSFTDGRLTLVVRATAGGYVAEMRTAEQVFPLQLAPSAAGLAGSFVNAGQAYTFSARVEGDAVVFETAGSVYRLTRAATTGGAGTAAPGVLGAAVGAAPAAGRGAAIAVGAYATLHEDDALAFIEALEFVLGQVGYPYRFSAAERSEALAAIARSFPGADQFDQLVLADARTIWDRVQANWYLASEREQREFALGVLVLAFGEQTVQAWAGPGGGAGGGGGFGATCGTFEECTSRFVDPQTWSDTMNAQGCWAAAGCEGYDTGTGTFTFNDYD